MFQHLLVYISNVANIPFDMTMYIMSVIVIAIGSVGYRRRARYGYNGASVSLSGTGLGAYFTSISQFAIDPLIDMGRTCLNVSGSLTNALVVRQNYGNHR
ncbi:MAG: cation:dicarboxylate symporter family transporter [Veillonella sp.]